MWSINWDKVSELIFESLLTGFISALVVIVTYYLGKRQSDINWKREIESREKEHRNIELVDLLKRRIAVLDDLLGYKGMFYYRISPEFYKNGNIFLDGNEINHIRISIRKVQVLFPYNDDIHIIFEKFKDLTTWTFSNSPQDFMTREKILNEIFFTLERKYFELESIRTNISETNISILN